MGEELSEDWVRGPQAASWEAPHNRRQNKLADEAASYSEHVQKFTGVKIGNTFPDAPSWWTPKGGTQSKGSMIWNCRRYAEFLRGKGFVIIASGERIGSPWFAVVAEQHYDEELKAMVQRANEKKAKPKKSAGGEIEIADEASNLPEASGHAAARAAETEPPPGERHV